MNRGAARGWTVLIAAHAALAVGAWWLLPHAFAWSSLRSIANTVTPLALALASLVAVAAALAGRAGPLRVTAVAVCAGWCALFVTAAMIFPVSVRHSALPWLAAMASALAGVHAWQRLRPSRALALLGALAGTAAGGLCALAQRAPAPSTRPADAAIPAHAWAPATELTSIPGRVARVDARSGTVSLACGGLELTIAPLLTFVSRSPDRAWAVRDVFDERPDGPARRLAASAELGPGALAALRYADDGESALLVREPVAARDAVEIEAHSRVPAAVFSHLNSFTSITVAGHRSPALAFSPCAATRVVVAPSDYPAGRPTTFGYLDAGEVFRVARARDAEKGPFTTVATGSLARGAPLAITLYDDTVPACRVTFADWSAQVSTEPSPTAGWGVPQNAVEFFRDGEVDTSPVRLVITLASTGVGRGFDSVGHAPGTYRNRVRVEPLR